MTHRLTNWIVPLEWRPVAVHPHLPVLELVRHDPQKVAPHLLRHQREVAQPGDQQEKVLRLDVRFVRRQLEVDRNFALPDFAQNFTIVGHRLWGGGSGVF